MNRKWFVAALVVVSLTSVALVRARQAQDAAVSAQRRQNRPTNVDAQIDNPLTIDEALILTPFGDYQPGEPTQRSEFVSHEKDFQSPGGYRFAVQYTRSPSDGHAVQRSNTPAQSATAFVRQYPDEAWAQYFAEFPSNIAISPDRPKQHVIVTQFDSKVWSDQLDRTPEQTWYPLYYIWPSGSNLIRIDYAGLDPNLDILRAYLQKYPSSIP